LRASVVVENVQTPRFEQRDFHVPSDVVRIGAGPSLDVLPDLMLARAVPAEPVDGNAHRVEGRLLLGCERHQSGLPPFQSFHPLGCSRSQASKNSFVSCAGNSHFPPTLYFGNRGSWKNFSWMVFQDRQVRRISSLLSQNTISASTSLIFCSIFSLSSFRTSCSSMWTVSIGVTVHLSQRLDIPASACR